MIKTLITRTTEVDDVDDAMAEIFERIDLNGLSKNSVGLLTCYYEFMENGIASELCKRLPFDVIGCTTLANATSGEYGMYMLCLTVLTSDDVSFSTCVSSPLSADNYKADIDIAYSKARAGLPGDPSLIVSFFPFMSELSGASLLDHFDKTCGGAPIFGTVASDNTMTLEYSRVIWNGQTEKNAVAMLLLHGNVNPRFLITSLPERNIRKQKAIITESDGCVLKRANDMKLTDYLESVGITLVGAASTNALATPFMVDYGNGEAPVALAVYHFGEDGSAMCGGDVPRGASFSLGGIDRDGIMETARGTIDKAMESDRRNGLIMFPCLTRYHMLSPVSEEEIEAVKGMIGDKIPFSLTYSGGEICPVYDETGKTHNRFHNFTFIACVF